MIYYNTVVSENRLLQYSEIGTVRMFHVCLGCRVKIPVTNFCDFGNSCISDSFALFLETFL